MELINRLVVELMVLTVRLFVAQEHDENCKRRRGAVWRVCRKARLFKKCLTYTDAARYFRPVSRTDHKSKRETKVTRMEYGARRFPNRVITGAKSRNGPRRGDAPCGEQFRPGAGHHNKYTSSGLRHRETRSVARSDHAQGKCGTASQCHSCGRFYGYRFKLVRLNYAPRLMEGARVKREIFIYVRGNLRKRAQDL